MNTSANNTPATVNNNRVNNAAKIQDFGQKIGGARKDLAREQADLVAAFAGLTVESLKTLSLSKVVKFEQVQRLAVSGAISAPAACAAFALWRSIPARPSLSWKVGSWAEKTAARLAQISAIIDGGEITENIERMAEYRVLMAAGYPSAPFSFGRYSVDYYLTVNSPLCVMAGRYYKLRTNDPSEAAEFIRKAVAADAATRAEGATFELYCSRGVYYAAPKGKNKIRVKEWNTREEARAGMEDVAELRRLWEKIRNTPALRRTTNRPRVGVDYRQGQNMNPEAFAAAFPFRGVEFGNWLTQTDRAIRLNETFDALRDLCALCGLTADAATLKGWLAMAFGSRGIPGAAAHFEHEHRVINLTKEHGAGSLAHEWLHALDAFTAARFAGSLGQFAIKDWGKLPEGELREAARALYSGLIKSPFARRSEDLDYLKGKTYYAKAQELAARAFEVYVIELAKIKGWTLDFLANVTTREEWIAAYGDADEYPYPTPAEVAELAPLFARFLSLAADAQELSKEAAQLFADGRAIMEQQREKAKELQEQAAQEQAEQRAAATAARMEEMKQRAAEVCAECGASWSYVFESAGRAYAVGGGAGFAFHIWANGHVGFKVVRLNSRIKKSIRTAWGDTLEVRPGVDLEAFARKDLQYGFTGYSLYNSVFKGYATTWQEFSEKHAEDIRKGAQEFAPKAQEVKKEATTSETAAQPTNTKANDGKPAQKPAKGEKRNRQEIDTTAAPAESLQLVEIADGVAVIPAEGYDYRATLFNRRQIKAHGATWNKEAQQWQATDPATVEALRAWFAQSAPAADEQQEQAAEPTTAPACYSDSEKSEIPAIAANRLTPADEPEPVAVAASYGSEPEIPDAVPAAYYSGSEKSETCSLYNFSFKNRTAEQWNCLTKFDTEADGEKLLQKTAEGHNGDVPVTLVEGMGHLYEEVVADGKLTAAHFGAHEAGGGEKQPAKDQRPHAGAGQEIGGRAQQVGPANLSQDAPPAGSEQASVRSAVGGREYQEQDAACHLQPAGWFPILGVHVPHQEKAQGVEEDIERFAAGHFARFSVVDEYPHQDEGEGSLEYMEEGAAGVESFLVAPVDGVGNGHSHGEEEQGIDEVGQSHAVFPGVKVFQEVGDIVHRPQFVHKDHEDHGDPPEHVNG